MVITNHIILGQLRTLIERTEVRYATYSRRYEAFRQHPVCANEADRELQMSIAYLYHTSLSILEERQKTLEDYHQDIADVLVSFDDVSEAADRDHLREHLFLECREEIRGVRDELRQIDEGIMMAKRHESKLMAE